MTRFNDIMQLSASRRVVDHNGFVKVPAVITRVGVQTYREDQLGLGLTGQQLVSVFRGPDTVFHADTIESFKHLPITDTHPPKGVSPRNAGIVSGGHIGEDIGKLSDTDLGGMLHLTDQDFIDKSKGSQTSAGYDAKIIESKGEYNGEPYQFKFDGPMLGNHLALVPLARCGDKCRVLDAKTGDPKMDETKVASMIDAAMEKQSLALADTIAGALSAHQVKMDEAQAEAQAKIDAAAETKRLADEATEQAKVDKAKIIADAKASAELRAKIRPLMGDKFDDAKTDKELLSLAFADSIEDAESKSVEYLTAVLDQEVSARRKGLAPIADSSSTMYGAVTVSAI